MNILHAQIDAKAAVQRNHELVKKELTDQHRALTALMWNYKNEGDIDVEDLVDLFLNHQKRIIDLESIL